MVTSAIAPSPTMPAAPEAPARAYLVPFTIDGAVPVLAANPWEAQRRFEAMSLAEVAAHGEFWAGEAELKETAADG